MNQQNLWSPVFPNYGASWLLRSRKAYILRHLYPIWFKALARLQQSLPIGLFQTSTHTSPKMGLPQLLCSSPRFFFPMILWSEQHRSGVFVFAPAVCLQRARALTTDLRGDLGGMSVLFFSGFLGYGAGSHTDRSQKQNRKKITEPDHS